MFSSAAAAKPDFLRAGAGRMGVVDLRSSWGEAQKVTQPHSSVDLESSGEQSFFASSVPIFV